MTIFTGFHQRFISGFYGSGDIPCDPICNILPYICVGVIAICTIAITIILVKYLISEVKYNKYRRNVK